jgi:hypothetical protein
MVTVRPLSHTKLAILIQTSVQHDVSSFPAITTFHALNCQGSSNLPAVTLLGVIYKGDFASSRWANARPVNVVASFTSSATAILT